MRGSYVAMDLLTTFAGLSQLPLYMVAQDLRTLVSTSSGAIASDPLGCHAGPTATLLTASSGAARSPLTCLDMYFVAPAPGAKLVCLMWSLYSLVALFLEAS